MSRVFTPNTEPVRMAPADRSSANYPPSLTRTITVVIEKHAANLLVLLVCASMIAVGLYAFNTIILPMSRANQDERDGLQQRAKVLESVASTLERATETSQSTAIIQQETTKMLVELTREIARERASHK